MHLPEPQLPNFFLSPQRLEQSLRTLRTSALSKLPLHTSHSLQPAQHVEEVTSAAGGRVPAKATARKRSQSEIERIARIFSSKIS